MTTALWILALILPLTIATLIGVTAAPPRPAADASVPAPESPVQRLWLAIAPLTALPAMALTAIPGASLTVSVLVPIGSTC